MTNQPTQLDQHLAHFQWRVLQDALTQATASWWEHRATQLEAARPRRGDYPGAIHDRRHPAHAAATNRDRALAKADTAARGRALSAAALACRRHAALLRTTGLDTEARTAIAQVLTEHLQGVA